MADAPADLWVFKATGRMARVIRVQSYRDHDVVVFRFIGAPGERRVSPRRFLTDFARCQPQRVASSA